MMSRAEEPKRNIQRAPNEVLTCPVCGRDVNNHTELESITCVHVAKVIPTQIENFNTEPKMCEKCFEQETAFRKLWSLIQDRAHPTVLSWRCTNCNQERQLTVA
jgi:hypothetical protein